MTQEPIELYPDEQNQVVEVWAHIQRKWMGQPTTQSNLRAMSSEAEQMLEKIGLVGIVDFTNHELTDRGEWVLSPIMSIVGRVNKESEHDHERHAFEVQHGFQDGRAGVLGVDGKLTDSKKKLILPGQ